MGLVEACLRSAWMFQFTWPPKNRVPRVFHIWMSLPEWLWAEKRHTDGLWAPWEPLGMAALLQTLSCFWNSSLGKFKEEKKNLNCVELLYLLHFFFFWKDKLVNRVIWNTIWQSFIFDILKATCSTHWSSIAEQECIRGETGAEAEARQGHSPVALRTEMCLRALLLVLVGGRDPSPAFSLLYPDVFLSITWALCLEMERASSGKEFFKELLLRSKMKLRI